MCAGDKEKDGWEDIKYTYVCVTKRWDRGDRWRWSGRERDMYIKKVREICLI